MKVLKCRKGFGLAEILIVMILLGLLYVINLKHLGQPTGKTKTFTSALPDESATAPVEPRVSVLQGVKSDIKNIENTLQKKADQYNN